MKPPYIFASAERVSKSVHWIPRSIRETVSGAVSRRCATSA